MAVTIQSKAAEYDRPLVPPTSKYVASRGVR